MDEDEPIERRWPRVCARVAGAMVLAVGLYFLSYGPVLWAFFNRSDALNALIVRVYAPMIWLNQTTNLLDPIVPSNTWWITTPGVNYEQLGKRWDTPEHE